MERCVSIRGECVSLLNKWDISSRTSDAMTNSDCAGDQKCRWLDTLPLRQLMDCDRVNVNSCDAVEPKLVEGTGWTPFSAKCSANIFAFFAGPEHVNAVVALNLALIPSSEGKFFGSPTPAFARSDLPLAL